MKLFLLRCIHFVLRRFSALDERIYSSIEKLNRKKEPSEPRIILQGFAEKDEFWQNVSIITHAGGGMQGIAYLNCREAFPHYYQAGNRVFEYDVYEDEQGRYYFSHSGKKEALIDRRFTLLSIEQCIEHIKENADIKVIFDCKFRSLQGFAEHLNSFGLNEQHLQRIVIQVFSENDVLAVQQVCSFHLLYVCMQETDYTAAAKTCLKYGIGAVSLPVCGIKRRSGWEVFEQNNICAFAYTVNTVDEYAEFRQKGIHGVFSDFLYEKDVIGIE